MKKHVCWINPLLLKRTNTSPGLFSGFLFLFFTLNCAHFPVDRKKVEDIMNPHGPTPQLQQWSTFGRVWFSSFPITHPLWGSRGLRSFKTNVSHVISSVNTQECTSNGWSLYFKNINTCQQNYQQVVSSHSHVTIGLPWFSGKCLHTVACWNWEPHKAHRSSLVSSGWFLHSSIPSQSPPVFLSLWCHWLVGDTRSFILLHVPHSAFGWLLLCSII